MIACPTCGRTDPSVNLEEIAREVEGAVIDEFYDILLGMGREVVIAVMGCEVNGPGEASHAHVGVAGARSGNFLLFARGERIGKITRNEVVGAVRREVALLVETWRRGR